MLTATAFFFAFTAGCVLAILRHPIYGLVTYVGLLYVHPPTRWWGDLLPSLRWSLLAAAVTLIAVVVAEVRTRKSKQLSPAIMSFALMKGALLFLGWLILQYAWALDLTMHMELIVLSSKYVLLIVLIYKCIDSKTHLKYFLWAHAGGCFYLGIIVFTEYLGGRFEGFHPPGINEANAASLQITTGVIVTFVLFLSGRWYEKIAAIGFMPFTLNALVATISRSGFLALAAAGVIFNLFASKKIRGAVRIYSLIGLALFVSLTNPVYWERISTILEAGEQIEGVDTGSGRLVLMGAQFEMFTRYPHGCGHRCTATLSPQYLDQRYLTGEAGRRARSSHNTFMSLLVEQGLPGAIFYVLLLFWIARTVFRLRQPMQSSSELLANTYTAVVASLAAITVGDVFVDYLKYETRVWFLALLMVIVKLHTIEAGNSQAQDLPKRAKKNDPVSDRPRYRRVRAGERL